jgi:hypothetical protein
LSESRRLDLVEVANEVDQRRSDGMRKDGPIDSPEPTHGVVRSRYYVLMIVANAAWHPFVLWLFLRYTVFSSIWFLILYSFSLLVTIVFLCNPMAFSIENRQLTVRWFWGRERSWPIDQIERRRGASMLALLGGFEEIVVGRELATYYIWPQFLADFDKLEKALKCSQRPDSISESASAPGSEERTGGR